MDGKHALNPALNFYLQDLGYTNIYVRFSGSGDSGDYESMVLITKGEDKDDISDCEDRVKGLPPNIVQEIESRFTKMSESHDWWNNDGGHGEIAIDLLENTYQTVYHIARTEHDTYSEEGSFIED